MLTYEFTLVKNKSKNFIPIDTNTKIEAYSLERAVEQFTAVNNLNINELTKEETFNLCTLYAENNIDGEELKYIIQW